MCLDDDGQSDTMHVMRCRGVVCFLSHLISLSLCVRVLSDQKGWQCCAKVSSLRARDPYAHVESRADFFCVPVYARAQDDLRPFQSAHARQRLSSMSPRAWLTRSVHVCFFSALYFKTIVFNPEFADVHTTDARAARVHIC